MLYVLDRAQSALCVLSNYYDDKHTKDITAGGSTYEFNISKIEAGSENLTTGNYLVMQDDLSRNWVFAILRVEQSHDTINVYAVDAGIELINKMMPIWDETEAHPVSYYVDLVAKNTPWKIGTNEISDLSRKLTYTGRDTGLSRFLSVMKSFDDAEAKFEVKLQGLRITDWVINIYRKIGSDRTDVQAVYSSELDDITKTESREDFVTALEGVGSTIEQENPDAPEQHVSIADQTYDDGDYYSPAGSPVLYARKANAQFNPLNGYVEDYYDYDTKSSSELLNRLLTQLKMRSQPSITYDAKIVVIDSTLDIGDYITIIDHDYRPALYLRARVLKMTKSYTDLSKNKVTMGNYQVLQSNIDDRLKDLQEQIKSIPAGKTLYTWVRYASDDKGTNMTSTPTADTKYVAIVSNKPTGVPSDNPADYAGHWQLIKGADGKDGTPGKDGVAGKDGVGVKATAITYTQSTSGTTPPTTGWTAGVPTLIKGQYLWTKTVWTYTDSSAETGYTVSYNAKDGNTGADGVAGKDGVGISNTIIEYVGAVSGTNKPVSGWSATIPAVPAGQYLWTRTTWKYTDGTSEQGFTNALMGRTGDKGDTGAQGIQGLQGPTGTQGIAGPKGIDGKTQYTHIAYANSADGATNFSTSDSNRTYVGMYVNFDVDDSTTPGDYSWTLVKGADGSQGTPGKPGTDGKTPYLHTAYSWSADGTDRFMTVYPGENLYLNSKAINDSYARNRIPTKVTVEPFDSTTNMWHIVAEQGTGSPNGIYLLGYANNKLPDTTDWSYSIDIKGTGKVQKFGIENGSMNPIVGTVGTEWSRISQTGHVDSEQKTLVMYFDCNSSPLDVYIKLPKLEIGNTPTPWTPSPLDDPEGAYPKFIGTYTDYIADDSTDPSKYTWAKLRGEQGPKGDTGEDGVAGKDGVGIKSTQIMYAQSTSGTTAPNTGWTAQVPTLIKGQYLWTQTTWLYTDSTGEAGYTVSHNAKDGNTGANGIAGKDGVGIKSTVIEYAASANGVNKPSTGWSTNIPTVAPGQFMWTRTTWRYTDSTNEVGYSVAQAGPKGPKGDTGQGIPGKPGSDGRTPYLHTAWANSFDGKNGFSTDVSTNKSYMGTYFNFKESDPTDPALYNWIELVGALEIGGRNLVSGTNQEYAMGYGIPTTSWKDGYAYLKLPIISSGEILPQGLNAFHYTLIQGATYTQTIWFETDATVKDLNAVQITWYTKFNWVHDYQPARVQKLGQNSYKVVSTYTWPGKTDNSVRLFDIENLDSAFDLNTGTYLKFGKLKLEIGKTSTDWSPAPEDTQQQIDTINQGLRDTNSKIAAVTKIDRQATAPTNPKKGDQWWVKDANGNINAFKIWDGTKWADSIIQQSAMNISTLNGNTINGATINGSEFNTAYSSIKKTIVSGYDVTVDGAIKIGDGTITNSYKYTDKNSPIEYTPRSGQLKITGDTISNHQYNGAGTEVTTWQIDPGTGMLFKVGTQTAQFGTSSIVFNDTTAGSTMLSSSGLQLATKNKETVLLNSLTNGFQILARRPDGGYGDAILDLKGNTSGINFHVGARDDIPHDARITVEGRYGSYPAYDRAKMHLWGNVIAGHVYDAFEVRDGSGELGGYMPIRASAFTVSSNPKYKTNIKPFENGLNAVKGVDIFNYAIKSDLDNDKYSNHIGMMLDNVPEEIVSDSEGIDLYSTVSVLWKAVQELSAKVDTLESQLEGKEE